MREPAGKAWFWHIFISTCVAMAAGKLFEHFLSPQHLNEIVKWQVDQIDRIWEASPLSIYDEFIDNYRLDRTGSPAAHQTFLHDPTRLMQAAIDVLVLAIFRHNYWLVAVYAASVILWLWVANDVFARVFPLGYLVCTRLGPVSVILGVFAVVGIAMAVDAATLVVYEAALYASLPLTKLGLVAAGAGAIAGGLSVWAASFVAQFGFKAGEIVVHEAVVEWIHDHPPAAIRGKAAPRLHVMRGWFVRQVKMVLVFSTIVAMFMGVIALLALIHNAILFGKLRPW